MLVIPSSFQFLTMTTWVGPMDQLTKIKGKAPQAIVNWAVMSVSLAP